MYWEHAGMLDLPDYARKWELKKAWYADNGILPHTSGGGPNGTLLYTDDQGGADAQAWFALAAHVLGVQTPTDDETRETPGVTAATTPRRIRKKAPVRRR